MKIHSIPADEIIVSANRQRKTISTEMVIELASSISKLGLIHPVVVRQDSEGNIILIAGERRLRSMRYLWDFFDEEIRCGDFQFPKAHVPCIFHSEMTPLDAFEMELEENVRRVDLTWQERAEATTRLMELRTARAKEEGKPPPTVQDIAEEIYGQDTHGATRDLLAVAKHLDNPQVAAAPTAREAFKLLKRQEQETKNRELAAQIGVSFGAHSHSLTQGDCFEVLLETPDATFDVLLTDPPYGIDADQFSDSGGRVAGAHFYDDSWKTWNILAQRLAAESFRITKPSAHAYVFCDIDNFVLLKGHFQSEGWRVFRTPLVWVNPTAMRAPWPEQGPQRKYQICLFAVKGDRPVNQLRPDVVTFPSEENLGHHAQKPVALYTELLSRSVRPGDSVLDPFGGTGPIIPAAHALKCKATYIEQDAAAYGIALSRLGDLK